MANRQHHERVLKTLQPGDSIRFDRLRGVYYHCGIYIGDSRVVHLGLAGENILDCFCLDSLYSPSGVIKSKVVVREDNFFDVVGGGVAYRHNNLDSWLQPLPPEKVVERAKEKKGEKIRYNLLTSNCEHFVTWCRYGVRQSEQVEKVNSVCKKMRPSCDLSESERERLLLGLALSVGPETYRYLEDTDYYPRSKPRFHARRKLLTTQKMKTINCTSVHERMYQLWQHGNEEISMKVCLWFERRYDERLCIKIVHVCVSSKTNRRELLIVGNIYDSSAGFETDTNGCISEIPSGRKPHPLKYMQVCYQNNECGTDTRRQTSTLQNKSTANITEEIVDLFFPYGLQTRHCHFIGCKFDDEYVTADKERKIFEGAMFGLCGKQKKGQGSQLRLNFTRSGSPTDLSTERVNVSWECPRTFATPLLCTAGLLQECQSEFRPTCCLLDTDETRPKRECKRKTKTTDQEVADRITREVMEFRFRHFWYTPMDILRNFWQGFKDYMFRTSSHDHEPAPKPTQSVCSKSTARNSFPPPASHCYTLSERYTPSRNAHFECPPMPYILSQSSSFACTPIQCTPIQCAPIQFTPMNCSLSSPCAGWLN